jgi:hypothetical protein
MDRFCSSSKKSKKEMGSYIILYIISVPFVYYLGILQLVLSWILLQNHILNQVDSYAFNVVNSILTKPVGGVLFGVAFWMVGKGISDKNIRDYMKLSAIGIMLLSMSNQDAGIYHLPYPPVWTSHDYIHGAFILSIVRRDILLLNFDFHKR